MQKNTKITCTVLVVAFSCLVGCILLGGLLWLNFKPQPAPAQETIFQGIEYIREVRSSPRPMVIHVIKIDLKAEGIRTLVTPGDPKAELPLNAQTTSKFLEGFNLQVAINGDGFEPWHSNSVWDYYPHAGDPVDVIGFAVSRDQVYSAEEKGHPVLYLTADNKARFNNPFSNTLNAISGSVMLVRNGKAQNNFDANDPQPRSAVGINQSGRFMILVVVDGRQPGYSLGATLDELAEIIIFHEGYNAMNLDGGGSSTLVAEGFLGQARMLNSPIDNQIPGRERAVGNHLGIWAKPLK
jgi:hypothetical protein